MEDIAPNTMTKLRRDEPVNLAVQITGWCIGWNYGKWEEKKFKEFIKLNRGFDFQRATICVSVGDWWDGTL